MLLQVLQVQSVMEGHEVRVAGNPPKRHVVLKEKQQATGHSLKHISMEKKQQPKKSLESTENTQQINPKLDDRFSNKMDNKKLARKP